MDSVAVKSSEMTAFNDADAFLSWEEGPYWTRMQKMVIKKVSSQLKDAESILEVGCGKSVYLPIADKNDLIAVGVDISKALLRLNKNGLLVLGDGEKLSFAQSSFDYVICIGSIHHMPDKAIAIKEIAKVCKYKIFIIEPHSMSANWLYWAMRKLAIFTFGYDRVKKWAGFVAPHESFLSKKTIVENLEDFELKIKFYSPFRAPPLKALSRINFESMNDLLEKVPGIRRMGTYIVVEAERVRS
jgi:ubiquinone/menaquinone biosynthesis C-methylase UbiE